MSPGERVVLVVEDEPIVRMLAVDMLDTLGWSALEAGGANEALRIAREGASFQAAMVDLGLPDRPGEEVVRELRKAHPDLPIIITTGRGEGDLDGDLGGPVKFLGKPYQISDLEELLPDATEI